MTKSFKYDITGEKFGRLTVIRYMPDEKKYSSWLCKCECGKEKKFYYSALNAGKARSCGCSSRADAAQKHTIHGHASNKKRTKTYSSWALMMDRCHWGNCKHYERYGAKGIHVETRWHNFNNFLEDMGERPDGKTIDRIDNNKGYSKSNCRWATKLEQSLNRSNTVRVIYQGRLTTSYELCRELGLNVHSFANRVSRKNRDYAAAYKSYGYDVERV